MYQMTYISTARKGLADPDIDAILAASRKNNAAAGITGLLVYDGVRFLQALEGEREAVERAFIRIKADLRHRAAVMLSGRDIAEREFGMWEMACKRVDPVHGGTTLAEAVDALVAGLPDANTRASFMSFARIDRSKAA